MKHFSGTHPKILKADELQDEVIRLDEEVRTLKREVEDEQREARKLLKPEYSLEPVIEIAKQSYFSDNAPEGTELLRFRTTLKNQAEFDEHLHYYGSIYNSPKEKEISVTYFRINKVLLHQGGGWLLLKDYQICSDEEWESMKQGIVPERLNK